MEVQGHRGDGSVSIGNTLPAFNEAILAGANAIEMDLLGTQDRRIVIHHDFSIKGKKVPICQLSFSEIRSENAYIPTLEEVFAFIKNHPHENARNIRLNLEIKRDPNHPELSLAPLELIDLILNKVRQNGYEKRVYYSSFDPESLAKVRENDAEAALGFIFDETSFAVIQKLFSEKPLDIVIKLARSVGAQVISPKFSMISDPGLLHRLKEEFFRIIAWTINDPEDWEKCIHMGIDGIITDRPRDLAHFLNRKIAG